MMKSHMESGSGEWEVIWGWKASECPAQFIHWIVFIPYYVENKNHPADPSQPTELPLSQNKSLQQNLFLYISELGSHC